MQKQLLTSKLLKKQFHTVHTYMLNLNLSTAQQVFANSISCLRFLSGSIEQVRKTIFKKKVHGDRIT